MDEPRRSGLRDGVAARGAVGPVAGPTGWPTPFGPTRPRRWVATALLALACGTSAGASAQGLAADAGQRGVAAELLQRTAIAGSDVVLRALALLGIPYRYGGDDPARGLDCSGLVRRVYADLLKVDLPHRADLLGRVGRAVARADLEAGDLLFFNTRRRRDSHVAIYIGDGRFIHAPGRGTIVRIDGLDETYWLRHYTGARRLIEEPAGAPVDGAPSAPAVPPPGTPAWMARG